MNRREFLILLVALAISPEVIGKKKYTVWINGIEVKGVPNSFKYTENINPKT